MRWQPVDTDPLDFDTGVTPVHARAIASALLRRAVPLLVQRDGRPEPLASGALYRLGGQVVLLTCRHIFDDGVTLGDLGVPLAAAHRILWLRHAARRVLEHPERDLALIALLPGATRDELLRHWAPVPLGDDGLDATADDAGIYVLAGWPYAQMRRVADTVFARPVVVFAPRADLRPEAGAADSLRVRYARVARRIDGIDVHAPALDGVSGATLWAVTPWAVDGAQCVLRPAAVQSACKHDAYARGEPVEAARAMFDRLALR